MKLFEVSTSKTFTFTLTVSNAFNSSAVSSVVVTMLNQVIPTVSIETPSKKFNTKGRIKLIGTVSVPSSITADTVWSCADIPSEDLSLAVIGAMAGTFAPESSGTSVLTLDLSGLVPGNSFRFALTATVRGMIHPPRSGNEQVIRVRTIVVS